MREILFKGKDALTKEWIYGDLVHCENGLFMSDKVGRFVEVIPETVGQFTGLFDCTKWEELSKKQQKEFLSHFNKDGKPNTKEDWKGKRIFEGDIVKDLSGSMDGIPRVVFWNEERMEFECYLVKKHWAYGTNCCRLWCIKDRELEVIGNIHDNKELLDKGE